MRLMAKLALVVLALMAGATFLAHRYYHDALARPVDLGDEVFVVEQGQTLNQITGRLVRDGVIPHPYVVKAYTRLEGGGGHIQAGEYQFPAQTSLKAFVDALVNGEWQVDVRVTVIEGWTFRQMREAIRQAPKLEQLAADWTDQQIMAHLGFPDLHPEGQFYPDTYLYRLGDTDLSLYEKSFTLMQQHIADAWAARSEDNQLETPYDMLIMASIIERESQVAEELAEISGVFHNRLRRGMRLQTDPTVIYGIGEAFDGNITRKHLNTDTPYNTYTRAGLTPTPISLPSAASLHAAVNPAQTESLYFVATGDGGHKFSKTLEEHNAAVKKYILDRHSG